MRPVAVCRLDELADATLTAVRAGGRELVLVRHGDQVYALRNVCPHQGARLSDGVLTCGRAAGGVGEHQAIKSGRTIRCPWHNWEFDAADGTAAHDPRRVRVATYPVSIEAGEVVVDVG